MDAATCLKKLEYDGGAGLSPPWAGTAAPRCATSAPSTTNLTPSTSSPPGGKDFCQELLADGRVQILGYTKYKGR